MSAALLSCLVASCTTALVAVLAFVFFLRNTELRNHVLFPRCFRKTINLQNEEEETDGCHTVTSWMTPFWRTTEAELLKEHGLDAVVYLRTFRFSLEGLGALAVLGVAIMCVNATGLEDLSEDEGHDSVDDLSLAKVEAGAHVLWTHALLTLCNVAIVLHLLRHHTEAICQLQRKAKQRSMAIATPQQAHRGEAIAESPKTPTTTLVKDSPPLNTRQGTPHHVACSEDVHERTVLITNIPPDQEVPKFLEQLRATYPPGSLAEITQVCDPSDADKLAALEEQLVGKLDRASWSLESSGKQPMHKTGLCGCVGAEVDSINTYTAELEQVRCQQAALRGHYLQVVDKENGGTVAVVPPSDKSVLRASPSIRQRIAEVISMALSSPDPQTDDAVPLPRASFRPAAFVTFRSVTQAVVTSQARHSADPFHVHTQLAPPPADIFWPNLGKLSLVQTHTRQTAVAVGMWTLSVFFMIPITFISSLTTLSNLQDALPFLEPVLVQPLQGILEGLLPSLALMVFIALLPGVCLQLAQAEGIFTVSGLERSQASKMSLFLVMNYFFGNIVSNAIFAVISDLVDDPTSTVKLFAQALPTTSLVFANLLILYAIGQAFMLFSNLPRCAVYFLKTRILAKSARQKAKCWEPFQIKYGVMIPKIQWSLMCGVVFSTAAPLVTMFAALYMCTHGAAARFQVLFIHEPKYESNGSFWSSFRKNVIATVYMYQVVVTALLVLKEAHVLCVALNAAAIFATAAFARYLHINYPDESASPPALFELPGEKRATHYESTTPYGDGALGSQSVKRGSTFWPPSVLSSTPKYLEMEEAGSLSHNPLARSASLESSMPSTTTVDESRCTESNGGQVTFSTKA